MAENSGRVDRGGARRWWDAEYAATPATEPRRFHILGGAIFPIYDKIMGGSGIQSVKVARAALSDGQAMSADRQALVGLNLAPADVPTKAMRAGSMRKVAALARKYRTAAWASSVASTIDSTQAALMTVQPCADRW